LITGEARSRAKPGLPSGASHSKLGAGADRDANLDAALQGLVRREKYASARIVSFRIARELEQPLHSLDRHTAMLDRFEEREIRQVAAELRRDRQAILSALQRLS
jgi:hypothetical protein